MGPWRNEYASPATKNAVKSSPPPDQMRSFRLRSMPVRPLLPSFFTSSPIASSVAVLRAVAGKAVMSSAFSARFCQASPSGWPTTARLRASHGVTSRRNTPANTPSAGQRAAPRTRHAR
ncbi:hypothetical protein [Oleiharenicola sp. Vm1]|uniref:hypothetical protein n=1 Tax=Oleiharenicola sp. Vm1 TaxID=3398393 RepID=UPI0039F581A8